MTDNKFNPDWDAMAVMVEEQQRMARRIEELTQREWVGLTDQEVEDLWGEPVDLMYSGHYNAIRGIEAKLKEKNGG